MPPTYSYHCETCDDNFEENVPIAMRETVKCGECGELATKLMTAPMVLRASYVDGNNRFAALKEAAKLEKEKAGSSQKNRKEIVNEIRKLGVRTSKEPI